MNINKILIIDNKAMDDCLTFIEQYEKLSRLNHSLPVDQQTDLETAFCILANRMQVEPFCKYRQDQ